ncbi:MAG: hypothetical protein JSS74_15780 [Actinobacteria bacterium]|nr:hypothetical protein [Actinomycetota bacterium]
MGKDILFVGADAGGNVPPMRAVATELADRGHRIAFAGLTPPGRIGESVMLTAISGREPGPARTGAAQMKGMMRMGMSPALGREVGTVIAERSPDAVVVDGIMISSLRAAERTGKPVAALFHSFGAVWNRRMARGPAVPDDEYDGVVPPNVQLRGHTPHAALLPRADLVIGHGGHSTTLAALAHGVPLLVLPMNRTSDQPLIGRIVQDAGLGVTLPRASSAAQLAHAIRWILGNEDLRARAARTGGRLRAQHGARTAADRIEELADG